MNHQHARLLVLPFKRQSVEGVDAFGLTKVAQSDAPNALDTVHLIQTTRTVIPLNLRSSLKISIFALGPLMTSTRRMTTPNTIRGATLEAHLLKTHVVLLEDGSTQVVRVQRMLKCQVGVFHKVKEAISQISVHH
jgi:hypothetical protein